MGTPEFAVPSLDILIQDGFDVVAVITAPDKPAGRGLKVKESAVKKYALVHNLPILQPLKLKKSEFIDQLRSFHADLQVVVAFRMLPEVIWNMPPLGTINLHASLLPQYRGAAPINWAIINGETETGVTTFKLQHEIDTGQVIYQKKVPILANETAGELHDKLMAEGAELLLKTVQDIASGQATFIPQSVLYDPLQTIHHAPKIFKEDCKINWTKDIDQVYDLIRGLSPYPAAWTKFNGKTLKIFKSRKEYAKDLAEPGTAITDHKAYLRVSCKEGWIYLLEIQPEGKKRMNIEDFLRGFREEEIIIS